MLAKFVGGLPEKLSFFVRAGRPTDIHQALTSAKMAEACGYREHPDSLNAVLQCEKGPKNQTPAKAEKTPSNPEVDQLREQMKQLNEKLDRLSPRKPSRYMRGRGRPNFQNPRYQNQQNTQYTSQGTPQPSFPNPRYQNQQNLQFPSQRTPPQAQEPPTNQNLRKRPIQCFSCRGYNHIQRDCNWTGEENTNCDSVCQICAQHGHGALSCKTLYSGNFKRPMDSGHGQSKEGK